MLTLRSLCSQSPKGSSGHGPTQRGRGKASAVAGVDRCHQPGQTRGGGAPGWTGGPTSSLDCDPAVPPPCHPLSSGLSPSRPRVHINTHPTYTPHTHPHTHAHTRPAPCIFPHQAHSSPPCPEPPPPGFTSSGCTAHSPPPNLVRGDGWGSGSKPADLSCRSRKPPPPPSNTLGVSLTTHLQPGSSWPSHSPQAHTRARGPAREEEGLGTAGRAWAWVGGVA